MTGKPVSASRTEQVQILLYNTMNGYKRLFGGRLMEWIDVVAAVVARRHCERNVTTAAVDSLVFKAPAHANDTILLSGRIVYAGRTSMEVRVDSYREELDGRRELINEARLILVAIGEDERPTEVPPVIPETDEEKADYEEAKKRREERLRKEKRETEA